MKIIIAGGTGAIGTAMSTFFLEKGNDVIVLSRQTLPSHRKLKIIKWDGEHIGEWRNECEGADVIINLCGKSVNCRYTEKNKLLILQSRLRSTRATGKLIGMLKRPPAVWFNAASATIYKGTLEGPQDEYTGETGSDFSMNVCTDWEREVMLAHTPFTRKIYLRTSIVLDKNVGALPLYKRIASIGLGGAMGSGEQMMSWIHIDDVCRAVLFLIDKKEIEGPVNITSPFPITNAVFMESLRRVLHMPFGVSNPEWMLRIGTSIIGTEMELLMKSRWVYPQKLLAAGFHFNYPEINEALTDFFDPKAASSQVATSGR
ncbi:MAG TPA: TIGR01777 family oxidoreductase [Chitinophagales bacterium]|nr:TIGR01777 family oxidoreductase [Chitinophagales bacterium]